MRKFVVPGVFTVAAVAVIALLVFGVASGNDSSSIDSRVASGRFPVPPNDRMALPMLGSSRTTTLQSFHGKVVVLNVFASWCDPCKTEAPLLAREQKVLRAHDGTLLGVTYQDSTSDALAFVHNYHLDYPIVRDVDGNFAKAYGVDGVPETFVIGRDGRIQALNRGPLTAAWINHNLPRILQRKA